MSTEHDDWWNQHICVCVNPSRLGAEILIQSTFLYKCCWDPNLCKEIPLIMGVSKNRGTPKSSILIGFSIIIRPSILGYTYFWKQPCDF